jgi:hypothetical protein
MGLSFHSWRERRLSGKRSTSNGVFKPVHESDQDPAPYPKLLPPMVGEHAEQSVDPYRCPPAARLFEGAGYGHRLS